jgi:hypothetical protein
MSRKENEEGEEGDQLDETGKDSSAKRERERERERGGGQRGAEACKGHACNGDVLLILVTKRNVVTR